MKICIVIEKKDYYGTGVDSIKVERNVRHNILREVIQNSLHSITQTLSFFFSIIRLFVL